MISDFELLTEKVSELAELAHALRRENAELRAHAATLTLENQALADRMRSAHDRVATLMARIPDPEALAAIAATQQEPA